MQQRIAVVQQNLTAQSQSNDISDWRYQTGLGTALDVEQAKFALEQSLAQLPTLRSLLAQAMNRLAAQIARVGVASAAQYPNFSLLGSIGLEALSAGNLFTTAARGTTLGANLAQPIFNAGRIRQTIAVQNALQE